MSLSHHRPARPSRSRRARRIDGGYVLAKFALLLVPLLLMTGLSVDVGFWYNRAADIQKAADAAALAGVVWLPDIGLATEHATTAAAKNGFVDGEDGVEIDIDQAGDRRLRVTITDDSVGSFLFLSLGGREIEMTREGLAEYVLPVPLGSPYNFFGMGNLTSASATPSPNPLASPTVIYQSVNPSCTSKINGDRHQSLHYGPLANGGATLSSCTTTTTNDDYRPQGYELYIEAPKNRTQSIDVLLYDPRYNPANYNPSGCTMKYPTVWDGPETGTSDRKVTATGGPLQYQTRSSSTTTTWSSTTTINNGQSFTFRRDRLRVKQASCDHGFDSKRQDGNENFTFSLYAADSTPLTDSDNPAVAGCTKSYSSSTAFELTYLGSFRWNKLCTITTGMPTGRYILRVKNGNGGATADGSNQWGLVAKYAGGTGDRLCDGRVDAMCPRVYGKDAISVYANTGDATASFFLAEIDGEHNGKTLELELWDPGEGGEKLEILRPNGTGWTTSNFSWTSFNDDGVQQENSGSVASINIASPTNRFNGEMLRIRIPLTNYTPLATNKWWKIQYTFLDSGVTDRTTWSAKVVGDPVHLLEEEPD
jgi:hypothetical protein